MQKIAKLVVAALAATILLSFGVSPASARTRFEISTTALLTEGRLIFNGGGRTVTCDVTLHITALTSLINKIRGELIGRVTAILTANAQPFGSLCAGLTSLPMLVYFESLKGRLPTITGGTLAVTGGFRIGNAFIGLDCLYLGTILALAEENPVRSMRVEGTRIPLFRRTSGECPAEGNLTGTMTVRPTLTIRLLER